MSPLVDSFLDQTTEALSNFELRLPGWRNLKAKARSKRDDAGGKSARNRAKI